MIELDELQGEAFDDARAIADAWTPPTFAWPEGVTIRRVASSHLQDAGSEFPIASIASGMGMRRSAYHLVTFPGGGRLIALTQDRDEGKPWAYAAAPKVIFHFWIDGRDIYALPHVCQMDARESERAASGAKTDWLIRAIGIEPRYLVGALRRTPREQWRTVRVGYGY